jgi:hypothetical protein
MWQCWFGHSWLYLSNYSRVCKTCSETRPGWGAKHLKPGDDFSVINSGKENEEAKVVNPDDFRK